EDIQQDLGLYGNLLVRDAASGGWSPVHHEQVVMLDDLLLGDDGLIPFGAERTTHALMGRFGNVLLVNGEPAPSYALDVQKGAVVRFFFTNVANTRTFNVSFPNARMKVVGTDIGRYEEEAWVESVVIAAAERGNGAGSCSQRAERTARARSIGGHTYGMPERPSPVPVRAGNGAANLDRQPSSSRHCVQKSQPVSGRSSQTPHATTAHSA